MRFKKNITINEIKGEYQPETYFSFNLPKKKLDLHSLTLYYTANCANASHIIGFTVTNTVIFPTTVLPPSPPLAPFPAVNGDEITILGHGLADGAEVRYNSGTGNTEVGGLTDGKRYFVQVVDADTIRLGEADNTTTPTPAIITYTGLGTGTQSFSVLKRTYRTIRRFLPRLSSCVIDECIVKVNNVVVQHIKEYNTLNAILHDIQSEFDHIDSTASDTVQNVYLDNQYLKNASRIQSFTRGTTVPSGDRLDRYFENNKKLYYIDKFLGFLGEGNRYIDATDKDIQIIIKLAPACIQYKGIASLDDFYAVQVSNGAEVTFDPEYILSDIRCSIDVVDDMPSMSEFSFKDYEYKQGMYLQNNKKCLTSISLERPVEYVLGTFKHPDYKSDQELQLMHSHSNKAKFGELMKNTLSIVDINNQVPNSLAYSYEVSKLQKDPYILNSSIYFSHQGDAIRYCRYRWNNYDLTPQLDIISCFNETKKCFNSDFKRVTSIFNFEADFFCNAIRVDDTSSEYKTIEWEVDVDTMKTNNKGGLPMLFVCTQKKI